MTTRPTDPTEAAADVPPDPPTTPADPDRAARGGGGGRAGRLLSPVVRHELADRFRGRRGSTVVIGYVAVMGLVLVLLYLVAASAAGSDFGLLDQSAVGRFLFENYLAAEFAFMLFVGAGYAAAQVASERERATLPLLQITGMGPMQIAVGKWGAVVAWQALLLVMGMPLAGAAAFFGGVRAGEVLLATAHMVVVAAAFSAVAVWISSAMRRTTTAIIVTYGVLFLVAVGPFVLGVFEALAREDVPTVSAHLHPLSGLAATTYGNGGAISVSVLQLAVFALVGDETGMFLDDAGLADDGWRARVLAVQWLAATAITAWSLWRASRRLRPGAGPRRRRRARSTDSATTTPGDAPPAPPAPPGSSPRPPAPGVPA